MSCPGTTRDKKKKKTFFGKKKNSLETCVCLSTMDLEYQTSFI